MSKRYLCRITARLAFAAGLLVVAMGGPAMAQVTYNYTGSTFDNVESPYTTADSISATFTTAAAIPANFSGDASGLLTSMSFSDDQAVRTLADTNLCEFTISTDANGAIVSWSIFLRQSDTGATENQHNLESYSSGGAFPSGLDQAGFDANTGNTDCSSIALTPAASVASTAAANWSGGGVPAPATPISTLSLPGMIALALMLFTMVVLVGVRSRAS